MCYFTYIKDDTYVSHTSKPAFSMDAAERQFSGMTSVISERISSDHRSKFAESEQQETWMGRDRTDILKTWPSLEMCLLLMHHFSRQGRVREHTQAGCLCFWFLSAAWLWKICVILREGGRSKDSWEPWMSVFNGRCRSIFIHDIWIVFVFDHATHSLLYHYVSLVD